MPTTPTMQTAPTARTRRTFATLLVMLTRSTLREPVGLFFTLILAPLLVAVLGVLFGNDPSPQIGGRGFMDATLPACACLVVGMTGIIILPTNQLQLRESGALTRLRATPLSPRVFVAADLTVNFLISMVGIVLALLVGALGFGVRLQGSPLAVLAAAALGLVAFLALGYMLAAVYPSSRAATGIGNGLFIVIMMTSGAFVPQSQIPQGVQRVARYSPFHYLVDLLQGMWAGRSWTDYGTALAVPGSMGGSGQTHTARQPAGRHAQAPAGRDDAAGPQSRERHQARGPEGQVPCHGAVVIRGG